jgi:hypothetical protein
MRDPVSLILIFIAYLLNFSSLNCSSNLKSGGIVLIFCMGLIAVPHPQIANDILSPIGNLLLMPGKFMFKILGSLIEFNETSIGTPLLF